jgi:FlaG/FlaF family flagellin (archaellin)
MDFESRKKKSWNEFGVSEIVGNILILMITVILFSGIMAFVQQMPVPEQATKVDFSAKATFGPGGTSANLTVTHAGGAVMRATETIVIVEVDGVNARYNMSDPVDGLRGTDSWRMGTTWAVHLAPTTYTSTIVVTVVDMSKKSAVWSGTRRTSSRDGSTLTTQPQHPTQYSST